MSGRAGRGVFDVVGKIFQQIVEDEKNTPEGKTNTLVMVLALIACIVIPFFSASTVEVKGGPGGWSFSLKLGDALGAFTCIVIGCLVCVVIVAGCNYFRRKA